VDFGDKAFKRINQKENTYVLGVFLKYSRKLSSSRPHVVLVNPSDMGNLGTAIRTLAGLNIIDLAIITPAADIWHPKTIRSSMGAIFHLNVEQFTSFEHYRKEYGQHCLYPFMLNGERQLTLANCPKNQRYSLIFGNEATGLPEEFRHIGVSMSLPQSENVDSLNLSVAVGIGAFLFACANGQI
jgi:TrmH family RNA methyltransferase